MVRTSCAVRGCKSSSMSDLNLRFHQFPRTEERCKIWVEACKRADLSEKTYESLKHTYMCSLHFEKRMYGRKTLKKIAVPTLQLPTDYGPDSKPDTIVKTNEIYVYRNRSPIRCISTKQNFQQPILTERSRRKRKLWLQSLRTSKKRKLIDEAGEDVIDTNFLNLCDKFLSPKLSAIAKVQIYLKSHCKTNKYTRELTSFCLRLYYKSPLAYRFLSKMISLPSKTDLAYTYFPVQSKSQEMWDILTAVFKNISDSERECVLCMDTMRLKMNLCYDMKGDRILGFHEVDGTQQPIAARYSLTLMVRGITSSWKQLIGFSFMSNCKIDYFTKTWILDTVKRLLDLRLKVRAVVSNLGPNFRVFSKSLGIIRDISFFTIDDRKIYYIYNVPNLMKCVRKNLMKYNFKDNGKAVQWEEIINVYENAKGTVNLIQIINYIFDLLNLSNTGSSKRSSEPYQGSVDQEELLEKAQQVLNGMTHKNKKNDCDQKFINAFNVTINSVRQLCNDMKSEGHDHIFTRNLNNDWLENFFRLVRREVGNGGLPTCLRYTRIFRKVFLQQILNLSNATNRTDDFNEVLGQLIEFSKNAPRAQTSRIEPHPINHKKHLIKEYDIPDENGVYYLCGYLLRRCVEKHTRECQSVIDLHVRLKIYDTCRDSIKGYQVLPSGFVHYIYKLEKAFTFLSFAFFARNNIGSELFRNMSDIEFLDKPCKCFPKNFLLKLFIRIKIFHTLKVNNANLKSGKNQKQMSVPFIII